MQRWQCPIFNGTQSRFSSENGKSFCEKFAFFPNIFFPLFFTKFRFNLFREKMRKFRQKNKCENFAKKNTEKKFLIMITSNSTSFEQLIVAATKLMVSAEYFFSRNTNKNFHIFSRTFSFAGNLLVPMKP